MFPTRYIEYYDQQVALVSHAAKQSSLGRVTHSVLGIQ